MKRRKTKKSTALAESPAWWKVGAPCAMVVAMLLFGAVLRASAVGSQSGDAPAGGARPTMPLAERAAHDARRLASHRGSWTLQFFMGCDESNLRPLVDSLEDEEAFFLLPYPGDEGCYRACWGRFRDKQDAQRPRAYPEPLQAVERTPWATPVEGVLP